jgi:hypothetical protein
LAALRTLRDFRRPARTFDTVVAFTLRRREVLDASTATASWLMP